MTDKKISLFAHTKDSFAAEILQRLGRGYQQASLVYSQLMRTGKIDRLSPPFKNCQQLVDQIETQMEINPPLILRQIEKDTTGKFLLDTHDQLLVESVLIPMQAGGTLCVSSQVGCRLGCAFCETGRMGLLRNLTTEEIVAQVYIAKHQLGFPIRNIVFMGMGEPFDNYEAVMQAVRILTDAKGLGFGKRHLTVSTSGLVHGIRRFMEEPGEMPNLAVSISAAEDTLRNRLMPINRKHNLEALYAVLQEYNQKTGREILVAYVLLDGVNDTLEHADQLAAYLKGLSVKINVIPYNRQTSDRFSAPEINLIDAFVEHLRQKGYCTLKRGTKGDKIMAACGQLGNLMLKARKNQLKCDLK